jgi:uncharacterized protein YutE (UPF0331/DUF86 family)
MLEVLNLITTLYNLSPYLAYSFLIVFLIILYGLFSVLIILVEKIKYIKYEKGIGWSLNFFNKKANALEKSVEKSKVPEKSEKTNSKEEADVLRAATTSLNLGIVTLAKDIEQEIRTLYASIGMLNQKNYISSAQALGIMIQKGYIPHHTAASLEIFEKLRNIIVHGNDSIEEREVIRVLDIGMTLLKILRSIPHEKNIVYQSDIDIYSDEECKNIIPGAKGLMLEVISPGGIDKRYSIFPTTKIGYYEWGKRVSWEWDLNKVWPETWYRNPRTNGTIEKAWHSSGNFIGRHIDEI